jgi:hypothetical protein
MRRVGGSPNSPGPGAACRARDRGRSWAMLSTSRPGDCRGRTVLQGARPGRARRAECRPVAGEQRRDGPVDGLASGGLVVGEPGRGVDLEAVPPAVGVRRRSTPATVSPSAVTSRWQRSAQSGGASGRVVGRWRLRARRSGSPLRWSGPRRRRWRRRRRARASRSRRGTAGAGVGCQKLGCHAAYSYSWIRPPRRSRRRSRPTFGPLLAPATSDGSGVA